MSVGRNVARGGHGGAAPGPMLHGGRGQEHHGAGRAGWQAIKDDQKDQDSTLVDSGGLSVWVSMSHQAWPG